MAERLWAPWRLEYVANEKAGGCFLCDIVQSADEQTTLLLKRGRTCAVGMNRFPYNNGHLMVFPFRHVCDLSTMTAEERGESMELIVESIAVLKEAVNAEGFNVGANLGKVAGAGLEQHVHLHIVPRWTGDSNFMPVVSDVRVIPQALLTLWKDLRARFQRP
jgi:ATP adenylyltransferase